MLNEYLLNKWLHIDGLLNTLGCDNLRLIHREAVL